MNRFSSPLCLSMALALVVGCQAGPIPGEAAGRATQALEGEDGQCLVPDETVTHSCVHAVSGPFVSASAQPYPGFVFTDISARHTTFILSLPAAATGYQGAVLYSPAADGNHAFFTAPGSELAVYDSAGLPVALAREGAVPDELCGEIDRVAVFHLESTDTYTVVYSAAAATVHTIVEYVGEAGCEECEEVHLHASRRLHPSLREDGVASLDHPIAFELPGEFPVTAGTVAPGTAVLRLSQGTSTPVECLYIGRPAQARFQLLACTGGLRAGDEVEADTFQLRINPSAALFGPVSAELEIHDEACGGHDHDEH